MKSKKHNQIPLEQILNMTKELSPDDLEIGSPMNLTSMIEQKDDYNPDDSLLPNPKVTPFGGESDEDKHDLFRLEAEEDFAKTMPTRDPNPENLTFLQGYEGELLREYITAATESPKINKFRHTQQKLSRK